LKFAIVNPEKAFRVHEIILIDDRNVMVVARIVQIRILSRRSGIGFCRRSESRDYLLQ